MDNDLKTYTTAETVKSNKKWFLTWRIIYPILGIVIIIESYIYFKPLLSPLPKPSVVKNQSQKLILSKGGEIQLFSSKVNFQVGDKVPVTIKISTGGYTTIGADLVLRFNPKILNAQSTDFIRGKIYNEYPLIDVNSKDGVVRISGVATNVNQGFNGIGQLGTINFKAKQPGKASIIVDFSKGKTSDSNIMRAKTSEDILGSVTNLNLTIK